MNEFEFIHQLLKPLAHSDYSLGLNDDVALLPKADLVFSTDSICENIHFLSDTTPYKIAQKLLRVNISDLLAKGVLPKFYSLNLGLNAAAAQPVWMKDFVRGLEDVQQEFNISLLGGDTTRSKNDLVLSATIFGEVADKYVQRNGATAGDMIFVTGCIGDSYLGLNIAQQNLYDIDKEQLSYLQHRYEIPQPRKGLGDILGKYASAALDISDGLLQDLEHVARNSNCGAVLSKDKIPYSEAAHQVLQQQPELYSKLLTHGDDYEILFTAAPEYLEYIRSYSDKISFPITHIGNINDGKEVAVLGSDIKFTNKGYKHF